MALVVSITHNGQGALTVRAGALETTMATELLRLKVFLVRSGMSETDATETAANLLQSDSVKSAIAEAKAYATPSASDLQAQINQLQSQVADMSKQISILKGATI